MKLTARNKDMIVFYSIITINRSRKRKTSERNYKSFGGIFLHIKLINNKSVEKICTVFSIKKYKFYTQR